MVAAKRGWKAVDMPKDLSMVFAVLGCAPDRNAVGAIYFGNYGPGRGLPLLTLDYDLARLDALTEWLPQMGDRVASLSKECRALNPRRVAFIEGGGMGQSLQQAAAGLADVEVHEIVPSLCVLSVQELAAAATTYVARDLVKFTTQAHQKRVSFLGDTRNHALAQITHFSIRTPDAGATELLRAWALGVLLALEDPPRGA